MVPRMALGGQRLDLTRLGISFAKLRTYSAPGKELQSEAFLCSLAPWGAPLCSVDQKVGGWGRTPYAYACVCEITSLRRREPPT